MRINPINNVVYQRTLNSRKYQQPENQTQLSPNFKGSNGRAICSVLGAAGALVGVAALSIL